jgi:hypothetical protein
MPYIKLRKQADGTLRYTAIVRIRRNGKMLHQEAKTFTQRSAAERWGKHREVALENPTALSRAQQRCLTAWDPSSRTTAPTVR